MGFASFLGGFFLAFSPAAAVAIQQVGRSPRRVILAIGSAFAWLIGAFFAALIWFIIPPLRTAFGLHVVTAVLAQEGARYGFLWIFLKGEEGFAAVSPPSSEPVDPASSNGRPAGTRAAVGARGLNSGSGSSSGERLSVDEDTIAVGGGHSRDAATAVRRRGWRPLEQRAPRIETVQTALAFGTGSGLAHALVMYGTILSQASLGPAVYFSDACPTYNAVGTMAVASALFSLNHIFWAIPALHAFRPRPGTPPNRLGMIWILASHLIASLTTLPSSASYGCAPALILLLLWTCVNAAAAVLTVLPQLAPHFLEKPVELFLIGR